jgi:hypothetical protein
VVEAHNREGLTLIDYLEEVDGEYNKITSQIRSVYDSLGTGVAVIGIQKRTDSDYARGGQGTLEKSRMYVAIDSICVVDDQPICAIKVVKLKTWKNKNLNFHEMHFRIRKGAILEPVSDWMVLGPGEREKYRAIYGAKDPVKKKDQVAQWVFTFKTKTGKLVGINKATFEKWEHAYPNLNLWDVLEQFANRSYKSPWLADGTGWIFQLQAMLDKENAKGIK